MRVYSTLACKYEGKVEEDFCCGLIQVSICASYPNCCGKLTNVVRCKFEF